MARPDLISKFIQCLEVAAHFCRQNYREFYALRGVRDFRIGGVDETAGPEVIAARALEDLCLGNKNRMDGVVCTAIVDFLDLTLGPLDEPTRKLRIKDLWDISSGRGREAACLRWAQGWYGAIPKNPL